MTENHENASVLHNYWHWPRAALNILHRSTRNLVLVSMCLSRQDASILMHHCLLGLPRDRELAQKLQLLTLGLSRPSCMYVYVFMRLDETNTLASQLLRYLYIQLVIFQEQFYYK